ncbi:MAG: MOSC domain-containing protein, partial [Rhodoglobus sp.]
AVYAYPSEHYPAWRDDLDGTPLDAAAFGENLTTVGLDVNGTRLGTVWRIGDTVEVHVTSARLPCNTFRGWIGEKGWLKSFTADARPGAYLRVVTPGFIASGDTVTVVSAPGEGPTIAESYLIELGLV